MTIDIYMYSILYILYNRYTSNLLYCYKDLTGLHYKLSELYLTFWPYTVNISICSKMHIFRQFGLLNKIEVFSSSQV